MSKAEPFWLLDIETNNMIGSYESEADALRDVLDTIERYGEDSLAVQSLGLTHSGNVLAEGPELAKLARVRLSVAH